MSYHFSSIILSTSHAVIHLILVTTQEDIVMIHILPIQKTTKKGKFDLRIYSIRRYTFHRTCIFVIFIH